MHQAHGQVQQSTTSRRLSRLHSAGLVDLRHEGNQKFYSLRRDTILDACDQIISALR